MSKKENNGKSTVFSVPAYGHVHASLPLTTELTRRNHRIIYFVTENFRDKVEAAGAKFRPYSTIGDDYFEVRELSGARPHKDTYELITTSIKILPELLRITHTEQPDYILFDGMCPWGKMFTQIVEVPTVASLSLMALGPAKAMFNFQTLHTILPIILRNVDKGLKAN